MATHTREAAAFTSPVPKKLDFPAIDIPSYIFHHTRANNSHVAQFFDADNPADNFDLIQAEVQVKRFAKGLQNLGLRPGDKVLLYSSNKLYSPIAIWGVLAAQCVFTGASPTASAFG